jgi:fructoselysine-6-P-deglycase FrlB-like protein
MEEMIFSQAALPERISRSKDARHLGSRIEAAAEAGEPVLFTGCGTSEHAARAAAAIVKEALPAARVSAVDAFEARLLPRSSGLVVAISHEGETESTIASAVASAESGAESFLITAKPELTPETVRPVPVPELDRAWCHTVAYMSPLLTIALPLGLDPGLAASVIESGLDSRGDRADDAARLAGCEWLLAVGSGVDEVNAREFALKVAEGAHVPATPLGSEKVLHGHLVAADQRAGLILLRFDPQNEAARARQGEKVRAAAEVLGMPVVELSADGTGSRAEALIAGAVAVQLLTLELCMRLGTNPDLTRREQPLYRQAAEAGGVG